MKDWTGTLRRSDDGDISGQIRCSFTDWVLLLSGQPNGRGRLLLEARFGSPLHRDDAPPWTDEADLGKPHTDPGEAYDCLWIGDLFCSGGPFWHGLLKDKYGGRIELSGKSVGAGHISLSGMARVGGKVL